jgi:ribosomal protein S18 acetylase RimI-like enzyme
MPSTPLLDDPRALRAKLWRDATEAAICDIVRTWAHGTILRATRYPGYYRYNFVRVEDDPEISAGELCAVADEALAGLAHRRLDFDLIGAGERVRGELERAGWRSMRTVLMRHEAPAQASGDVQLEEIPYEAIHDLRVLWHSEDFDYDDSEHFRTAAKEVAMSHGARIFAVMRDGRPIAFAQLETMGDAAEITQVYVHPEHRGRGLGTAITTAAIEAAGDIEDLWIGADDEDRPKELYERLGFRPVWITLESVLLP